LVLDSFPIKRVDGWMASQGMQQVQKQTQSLVLAPQLRQSLKILQVPALELRQAILGEIQINPLLEEMPMEGVSIDEETTDSDAPDGEDPELNFTEGDYEILRRLGEDWRDDRGEEENEGYTRQDAERRQHFFDSIVTEESLQEHLLRQARLSDLDEEAMEAFGFLIGSLDRDGFVSASAADLALNAQCSLAAMQKAMVALRSFEPVGIGARDRAECLLLQLESRGQGQSLAARIVRDHYPLLLRRRIPELARKLGLDSSRVQRAIADIARLDPSPARRFAEDSNRVVVPDVKVFKDGGEWRIVLNNDYIPRLRISSLYKDMVGKATLKPEEKAYILEKIRSGRFLIQSIEQRQQTIERIARALLKFQADFFEEGVSRLRPLTMGRIADELGVHETTVSRAIANKYIDTPFGVYDLKFFFTAGFRSSAGDEVSNRSVKEMIVQMVEEEDSAHPLSDQELVRRLQEKGMKVARRTVAKYREEIGILPTHLRRRYS